MTKASIENATIRDLSRLWHAMSAIVSTSVLAESGQNFGFITETASRICNEADAVRLAIRDEVLRRPVESMNETDRITRTLIVMAYAADSGEPGEIFQELVRVGASSLMRAAA